LRKTIFEKNIAKMIRISQLQIEHIGPFKKEILNFSIEKNHPDIHIFTGPNGSGKTSILHALASEFDYFENNHKEHTSNLFYKRFLHFEEDKKGMAKSYAHVILRDKEKNEVIDKIVSYGCEKCGNLHQKYEKTISNSNHVSKNGNNYRWESHADALINYKNAIISKSIGAKKFQFAAFGYSGYRLITSAPVQFDTDKEFNPLHLAKYMEGVDCLLTGLNELTDKEFTFEVKTDPWKVVVKYHKNEIEFDVLPDVSWLGDLLMRLDAIPWENKEISVNKQNIILLLDEIEVHLHPKWQYYILPLIRKLFPNAQIFLSTHSPFVINSIDNAKIYSFSTNLGHSRVRDIRLSNTGFSYEYVYSNILETHNRFGVEAINKLKRFKDLEAMILKKDFSKESDFINIIEGLKTEGEEVFDGVSSRLFRIKRLTGKDYFHAENK